MISFELITGSGKKKGDETRWYVVGGYSPPSDTEGEARRLMDIALDAAPKGSKTMVIGDLNANLEDPQNGRDEVLSAGMRERGLGCATRHFLTRRRRYVRGRWTYKKRCESGRGGGKVDVHQARLLFGKERGSAAS